MLCAFKVMAPVLESGHDCKHFAIVNVVVAFGRIQLSGPECDGVEFSMRLAENAEDSEVRGISVQIVWKRRVEMSEDGRCSEELLELFECGLRLGGPFERLAFVQQVSNREDNARVSIDKTAVEVGESEEYLNVEDGLGDRPFSNGLNAFWVHRNPFGGNDESKETDFLHVKLAFLNFCVESGSKEFLEDRSDMEDVFFE
jgi:hypothetical protein